MRACPPTSSRTLMLSDTSTPTSSTAGCFGFSFTPTLGRTAVSRVTASAASRNASTTVTRRRVACGWPRYVQTVKRTNSAATTANAGRPTGYTDHGYAGRDERK